MHNRYYLVFSLLCISRLLQDGRGSIGALEITLPVCEILEGHFVADVEYKDERCESARKWKSGNEMGRVFCWGWKVFRGAWIEAFIVCLLNQVYSTVSIAVEDGPACLVSC
jgi:hypothetical protein